MRDITYVCQALPNTVARAGVELESAQSNNPFLVFVDIPLDPTLFTKELQLQVPKTPLYQVYEERGSDIGNNGYPLPRSVATIDFIECRFY
jgi:hypothetical protein